MQPLVQKWTGITDKSGKIHTAKIGNYLYFYFLQIMKVRHTLCITNKQRLTEDPIQCGCVRGFLLHACVFWWLFFQNKLTQIRRDKIRNFKWIQTDGVSEYIFWKKYN